MVDRGTIVAIATPEGRGGLSVVRLSGDRALTVARQLMPNGALSDPVTSHRARLAVLRWPATPDLPTDGTPAAGDALDEALVLPLLGPRSFTGEDTVEFFCHGGLMPARMVVAACRAAGARAAAPGEFSRRAFLNGRLSLSQAEAVADLIAAEHTLGARAALAQLQGGLQTQLEAVETPLRQLLAELEGSLEFSDDEDTGPGADRIRSVLNDAVVRIDDLLDLAPAGRRLRDGIQVVFTGPPNAGKSSLFNALLGRDRALVDDEAGTTRDVVTAHLELDGMLFVLHDTAGLRDAATGVEAKGIARTRMALDGADIVLDLCPVAQPAPAEAVAAPPDCEVIAVGTKGDLATDGDGLVTSSVDGTGIAELRAALLATARRGGVAEAVARGVLLNQRHQDRLRVCRRELVDLAETAPVGAEVAATLLSTVMQDLGTVSGRVFSEQILGEVFDRFCVGK